MLSTPTVTGLEALLVDAYGAADPVRLDGVGGATTTTAKAAIVGRSDDPATES